MESIYAKTQEFYKRQNVNEITAYRAVQKEYVTHGELEAWTTDKNEAVDIAGFNGDVLTAKIPRSAILWSTDSDPRLSDTPAILKEVTVLGGGLQNIRSARAIDIATPEKAKEFRDVLKGKSDAEIEFLTAPAGPYEQARSEGWVVEADASGGTWITKNGHHILIGQQADLRSIAR